MTTAVPTHAFLVKFGRAGLFLAAMVPLIAVLASLGVLITPWKLVRLLADGLRSEHLPLVAYWLGLLSLPGYAFAVVARSTARASSPPRRWWVRLSLVVGSLCAALGLLFFGSAPVYYGGSFVLAIGCAAYILWDFERRSSVGLGRASTDGRGT